MRTTVYNLYIRPYFFIIEILYLIVIPLLLLYLYPQLIHLRMLMFFLGFIYVWMVSKLLGFTVQDLGFVTHNFISSFRPLITPTILIICFVAAIYLYFPEGLITTAIVKESAGYPLYVPLAVYILFSVPLQEIIFRAFFIPRLTKVSDHPLFLIILSSIVFGVVHISLGNILLTLTSGLLGVVWGYNFVKYRNIYSVMLSHSLVGSAFIYSLYLLR